MMILKRPIFNFLATSIAIFLIGYYEVIPGVYVTMYSAAIVALLMALLNLIVRPLLVMIKVPIILFTYWLFTVVINTAIFWFIGTFVRDFRIENIGSYEGFLISLLAALIISGIQSINQKIFE